MQLSTVEENYARRCGQIEQLQALEKNKVTLSSPRFEAIARFQKMYEHCPFPAWIKDSNFTMLAQNPAYTEIYLPIESAASSFVGMEDQAWGSETADEFHTQDKAALQRGYVVTHEVIYNPVTKQRERLLGAKWHWDIGSPERGTQETLIVGMVTGNIPEPNSARSRESVNAG